MADAQDGRSRELAVVICAYTADRWKEIGAAVRSALDQGDLETRVILVIDHAPDLLDAARSEFIDPRIVVTPNTGPRGLSGARNTGVSLAQTPIVAFLDDDATAERDWATRLLAWYDDEAVLGVGGASLPIWKTTRPTWFPEEFDWVVGCTYRGMPRGPAPVRNVIGSNMSFRRELFGLVGGFDSSVGRLGATPVGCEETEFCIRLTTQVPSGRIMYDPSARVRHHLPRERERWRYFRSRCLAEGRSKAIVAQLVGRQRGLASERAYATRTLPAGVLRAVREAIQSRRPAPLARAGTIVAGLALTSAGYVAGRLRVRRHEDRLQPASRDQR
ncbi:MAG TPA: glycosyltransferase family 2 protein [Candidatus Limnocylindria bacterium]